MGSADRRCDAVLNREASHSERRVEVAGPVINSGQHMAVYVDHKIN